MKNKIQDKMCRILIAKSEREFEIGEHLRSFASLSRESREFQGHGWGCAYLDNDGRWNIYRNIMPIWEDNFEQFGRTTLLVAHARSAFEDRDIAVENNMPFFSDGDVFVFNGELRGVRIKEEGRIGAEKIFNFMRRIGDLEKAVRIVTSRTRYVRGMNIAVVNKERIFISTQFSEDDEYYTMHVRRGDPLIVCSKPYGEGIEKWGSMANGTIEVFE